MGIDAFRFDGKKALVVGGSTGIGGAAVTILQDLGAEIVVMDYADVGTPGVEAIKIDLREQASVDAVVDACEGPFDVVLSCAGVAHGTPGLEKVNFIGQRHLLERLINEGQMAPTSAIAMIASVGGFRWETELPALHDFLDTPDWDSAVEWIKAHPEKTQEPLDYNWSKMAVCAYVARRAYSLLSQGIRINAVLPGVIDTGLARANSWLDYDQRYRAGANLEPPTPESVAYPLVFLCSDAARLMAGSLMVVDAAWVPSGITQTFKNRLFPPLTQWSETTELTRQ